MYIAHFIMIINMRFSLFFYFIFLTPIFTFSHEDWSPVPEEKKAFEQVLRHLLSNTEMGYVLYGEKPVWIEIVPSKNGLIPFFARRGFLFSFLNRFACYLEALKPICTGNVIIKNFENQILFINKKTFLKTVSNNLPLFQYVLGPEVTPEGLLNELLHSKQTLCSLLKNTPALIGIVLGYGTQNALFGARSEWLQSRLYTDPVCPLFMPEEETFLLKKNYPGSSSGRELPSFGFSSLQEECDFIHKKIFLSWQHKEEGFPSLPVFGCLDSEESRAILDNFAQAREKIRNLLSSDQLLENFLKDCEVKLQVTKPTCFSNTFDEKVVLAAIPSLFDQLCATNPKQHDAHWQAAFIEGLKQEPTLISAKEFVRLSLEADHARRAFLTVHHLNKARLFFQELQQRTGLICISPDKLYYKVLEKGLEAPTLNSPLVAQGTNITLCYSFETISQENPALGCYEKMAISDFQPGTILCMLGMRVGESREVWIHPDYSGGKGPAYHGKIQILQCEASSDSLPICTAPSPSIISEESETDLQNRFWELQKKTAFAYASAVKHTLQYGIDPKKIVTAFSEHKVSRELNPYEEEMVFLFYLSLYEKQQIEEGRIALEQFSNLPPSATCVIKDRLYVEYLQEGTGTVIEKDSKVKLYRRIKNHLGLVLSEASSCVDLKNSIKAFKIAIPGQKIGSKIRLFIHPEYGFKESVERVGDSFLISEVEILPMERVDTRRQ